MPSENCVPKCVRLAHTSDGMWKCKACGREVYCVLDPDWMEMMRDKGKGKGNDKGNGKDKGQSNNKGKEKGNEKGNA